jgi:phage major head subunit gpT-like protein
MIIDRANLETAFKGFKSVYNEAFAGAPSHIDTVAMRVGSGSAEEEYGWLGQFPSLREWIGDRVVNGMKGHGFKIRNRKFESTVSVKRDDMADDRFGIYKPLFSEMGRVTKQHPDTLAFALLTGGFTETCFDGQSYFDPEHPQEVDQSAAPELVSNMQAGDGPAWFLLDCSRGVKPIVFQERETYEFQSVTDGHDYNVFMKDEYLYGIRARVNVGFGLWQLAFGSKAGLTAANYAAARAAMMDFRGDRGHLLGITPTHLVVPPALEVEARTLLGSDVIDGSSNVWKGTASLIITPYAA